ncbi:MAG: D-mannonate epimerase [Bacteroides sp. SM23_62_1]|nr:MAG: D-mannonate epimerase [Bacteroides sp. SM23_62_1]
MLLYQKGSEKLTLSQQDLEEGLIGIFEKWGKVNKVLAIPPDYTRFHSFAGLLTQITDRYYGNKLAEILPALGTHAPMTQWQLNSMFPGIDKKKFRVHNWREDVITIGEVPKEFIYDISEGKVNYSWPAQINKKIIRGGYDLVISIGQVVPHEVVGMANYNKNIFIGIGGKESINKSHFLGAVYGMERMMGRANTPVRKVLNYASEKFAGNLPVLYVLTVVGVDDEGKLAIHGLFIGDDEECFLLASELSLKINFTMLEKPLNKVVVYLDPEEFHSTWLGNKSIYRTRMAIADGGELIVLAPGVREFGEDQQIDQLIRKYGYSNTPKILEWVKQNSDLQNNLSAAAHLIHGSSEERFNIIYCPGYLNREEIEMVNFQYGELKEMIQKYDPEKMKDGFNTLPDGEQIFYISNPALGLWAFKDRFDK